MSTRVDTGLERLWLLPAGAAWARGAGGRASLVGVDQSSWALAEARASLGALGLRARLLKKPIADAPRPQRGEALVAAFAVNELLGDDGERKKLLERLVSSTPQGATVLIVEPIALRQARWWEEWSEAVLAAGGALRRVAFWRRAPRVRVRPRPGLEAQPS